MKKLIFTFILLSLISLSFSQTTNYAWAQGSSTISSGYGKSTTTDNSGNIIVVGDFSGPSISFSTTTLSNNGLGDIFMIKYSPSGNVIWVKGIGGSDFDYVKSVSTDPSGNILITGYFNSPTITFGSFTLTNSDNTGTSRDIFIAKFDPMGNVLWAKSAGGPLSDYGYSVDADAMGTTVVGAFLSNTISFGSQTLTCSGAFDAFIVRFDPSGNVLWALSAGGASQESALGVVTDVNGSSIITGSFRSSLITFGSTTLNNTTNLGNADCFVTKIDPFGNVLWAKNTNGTAFEEGKSVFIDSNGNVFVLGDYDGANMSIGTTTITSSGGYDFFIAKYDALGNHIWLKAHGGTANDYGQSITTDTNGNAVFAGYFQSPNILIGSTTHTNTGNSDLFAIKYDSTGSVIWSQTWGGTLNDIGYGISSDATGNIMLTGSFESPTINFGLEISDNVTPSLRSKLTPFLRSKLTPLFELYILC
ncbi:MAG: hypothetical protein JNJ41_05865 [Bacteroidia bacterium]|nr:hypothetical protein [Bacteroidia bacterium]